MISKPSLSASFFMFSIWESIEATCLSSDSEDLREYKKYLIRDESRFIEVKLCCPDRPERELFLQVEKATECLKVVMGRDRHSHRNLLLDRWQGAFPQVSTGYAEGKAGVRPPCFVPDIGSLG